MCLYHNTASSVRLATQFINDMPANGELTFYKVIRIQNRAAYAPSRDVAIELDENNYYVSDRAAAYVQPYERGSLSHGIHVYLTKEYAESQWNVAGHKAYRVLPVYARLSDFVAADANEAAFTKVRVAPNALRSAIRAATADVYDEEVSYSGKKVSAKKRQMYLSKRGPIVRYTKRK
jgi:hypothetical protein